MSNRRNFIKKSLLSAGALSSINLPGNNDVNNMVQNQVNPIKAQSIAANKPVAIAMWDFSWLLRHHRYGEFENWDKVLDELAERGYNAIRMDCFPQYVASDKEGKTQDEYYLPKNKWNPALWGNNYSIYIKPKEGLIKFLSKCHDRGFYLILSTWFFSHDEANRNETFEGLNDFIKAWDETLQFLKEHDVLKNILYIDLLNEYPAVHGYTWLFKQMNDIENGVVVYKNGEIIKRTNPTELEEKNVKDKYLFCQVFINTAIKKLKRKWPNLKFYASLTYDAREYSYKNMELKEFDAFDMHLWFIQDPNLRKYEFNFGQLKNDTNLEKNYKLLLAYYKEKKRGLIDWIDHEMQWNANYANKYNAPIGNTEGWGPINWIDHPLIDWKWTKETGEICTELAIKHNYQFICTSNFTHPQFKGIWEDIKWHKNLTAKIKKS